MYIMVKTYKNLQLLARDSVHELSILESRKTTRLSLNRTAEDYNLDLLQNGWACAAKQAVVREDFGNPLH
jgi:hypothetical protein